MKHTLQPRKLLIVTMFFFIAPSANSQISISGPSCVKPNVEYHYSIDGVSQSISNFKLCVRGGMILDAPDSCLTQFSSSIIKIKWMDLTPNGAISVKSNNGANQNLHVNITADLQPGDINSASLQQLIAIGSVPDTIQCSPAKRGNCSPSYAYQWQQSTDKVVWQDITSATRQNLKLNTPVNEPVYYRRKVTEESSGTVKYTDLAAVYIIPVPN